MSGLCVKQTPLVLVGAGGHAKVLQALALDAGYSILGVCDPRLAKLGEVSWRGLPVLGGDEALEHFDPASIGLINGIGQIVGNYTRSTIFARLRRDGFCFPSLVHPNAWVAPTAKLDEGVQIMAGAMIQPDCEIGENTIVNTGANIDHDCKIGRNVHVAPGATLCGGVTLCDQVFVGSGATIIQGIRVNQHATVGAGAVVIRDVAEGLTAVGIAKTPISQIRDKK